MIPYNFVRIDGNKHVQRSPANMHDQFQGLAGHIEGTITTLTPLFIPSSQRTNTAYKCFITNRHRQPIIPGSSLKGLIRSLVETIGPGCWWLFDKSYEGGKINYGNKLPGEFHQCRDLNDLCVACRMFGLIKGNTLLQGHVNFDDALCTAEVDHPPIYTIILSSPKPRHAAYYLDEGQKNIAGRKFYYHHSTPPQDKGKWLPENSQANQRQNAYIKPLGTNSVFNFSANFDNLQPDELQLLLYALVLEPGMRHKIGYAKPAGLGSIHIELTKLDLIDYTQRYKTPGKGVTTYTGGNLQKYIDQQTSTYTADQDNITLQDLRNIWRWPGYDNLYYPSYNWFRDPGNSSKRLAQIP